MERTSCYIHIADKIYSTFVYKYTTDISYEQGRLKALNEFRKMLQSELK